MSAPDVTQRSVKWPWGSELSDGAKGLWLLLDQPAWTYRRVESLSFLPSGETRRRISWDFAVPHNLAIAAGPGRVAVPIATLDKRPLKRLDVRDRSGGALPVWGREQNGHLAADVLLAGLETLQAEGLSAATRETVRDVVFARSRHAVDKQFSVLFEGIAAEDERTRDLAEAVRGVAETLADGFLLVVELPEDAVGLRSIVKVSYDDDRLTASESKGDAFTGRSTIPVEVRGWVEAQSWHLEVHAPDGLNVEKLGYEIWDSKSLDVLSADSDGGQASTAHITGAAISWGYEFAAEVRLTPTTPGLLNQVTLGVMFALALLVVGSLASEDIAERLTEPGRGTSLATVAFSIPAFLLALLSRSREHHLVSRVLMTPRLISFASALTLWAAGLMLAWTADAGDIRLGLGLLAATQLGLLIWAYSLRPVRSES